jgi:uncharacterized protein YbjT (DUF2867 family)
VPYSTIRPAIFSASLLAAAPEVRASRTWTGLAGLGRMALIDHRDAAEAGLRGLTDPALWGAHHDLTGPVPMSWPEALELLSAELGDPPAGGLYKPIWEYDARTLAWDLGAHLAYGAGTATAFWLLTKIA